MAKKTEAPKSAKPKNPGAKAKNPGREREAILVKWERRNVILISAGLAAVALGYVLLSQGDVTAAPLLLVTGYCILIPLAFIL